MKKGQTKKGLTKRIISFVMILCMLMGINIVAAPLTASAEADVTQNLAGYWNFDEDSGTAVTDISAAGTTHNGTLSGTGVSIVSDNALSGKMLKYTGVAGSKLTIPSVIDSSTSFSISLWINMDSTANNGRTENLNILQQSGTRRTLLFYTPAKKLGTYINGSSNIMFNEYDLPLDKWVNLTLVLDASAATKKMILYADGVKVSEANVTLESSVITDLIVGCHKNNPSAALNGPIKGGVDEIRFYNAAVTAEQAAAIFELNSEIVYKYRLSDDITAAESLAESGRFDAESEVVKALTAQLDSAKAVRDNADADKAAILDAIDKLKAAVTDYNNAAAELPILITVNTDSVIRTIPENYFGLNHRYYDNALSSYDPVAQAIRPEFDAYMKDMSVGSVRYPGGTVGNLFRWKDSIGDISDRKTQTHGLYANNAPIAPNFGLGEAAAYIYDELNSDMIYMYGMGKGSAQDAADLVEYLNCEVGENPNGGIDWAQVRAENGHPEPFGVTHFEIGNEMFYTNSQDYWMSGRQGNRSLFDAYVYGSAGKDGTYSDANAIKFSLSSTGASAVNATYVTDYSDWRNATANSNGQPNQVKYIKYAPIVAGTATVYVNGTAWTRVDSFEGVGRQNVYTLDYNTGKVTFGDGNNGNIPPNGQTIRAAYTTKQDGFVDYYEAMKAVDPNVKLYCSFEGATVVSFMKTNNEDRWDGYADHPYSQHEQVGLQDGDSMFYEKIMEREESRVNDTLKQKAQALVDNGFADKSIAVSEFGIHYSHSYLLGTQTGALYNAKVFFALAKQTGIAYLNRHCVNDYTGGDDLGPGLQAVIQSYKNNDGTASFVSTPSARMFEMFGNMTGTTVINETLSDNYTFYNNVKRLHTLSTMDDKNIYLAVMNLDRTANTAVEYAVNSFSFEGKEVEVWSLSGDAFDSANTLTNPDAVDIVKTTVSSETENLTITVPAHGIVMIKAAKTDDEPVVPVDTAALEAKIKEAQEIESDIYTEESFENLANAIAAAQAVMNNEDKTQEQVDEQVTALTEAINALEEAAEDETFTLGDVNGDGTINAADAVLVLQYFAEIDISDKFIMQAADVDGNDAINASDGAKILQKFAGIIEEF